MKKILRRQLTLFVDGQNASEIEKIREQFNPIQFRLIASHVTLCREDEIEDLPAIMSRLQQNDIPEVIIRFGKATRFANGKGVLMPASGESKTFHQLRSGLLAGLNGEVRRQEPHITLMHPRNSVCTHEIFEKIQKIPLPSMIRFDSVSLIEQVDNRQWQILKRNQLRKPNKK